MESTKQKRAATNAACAACHSAKRKCDGVPCARCSKLGRECVEYVPKKRGPQPGKKRATVSIEGKSAAFGNPDRALECAASAAPTAWQEVAVASPGMLALLLRYAATSMIVEQPVAVASSLGVDLGGNYIAVEFPLLSRSISQSLAEFCLSAVVMACRCDDTIPLLEGSCEYYTGKRLGEFCVRERGAEEVMEQALRASPSAVPHVRSIHHSKLVYAKSAKLFRATMRMTLILDENGTPRYGFSSVLSVADDLGLDLWPTEQDSVGAVGDEAGWALFDTSSDWSVETDFFGLGNAMAIGGQLMGRGLTKSNCW